MTETGDAYWMGWFANAIVGAAVDLEAGLDRGSVSKHEVASGLIAAIDAALEARPDDTILKQIAQRLPAGFSVEDQLGECYALRSSYVDATRALVNAQDYLHGAETCGHPRAGAWVHERLPFTIRTITRRERALILEDGTPVLDREP